MSNFNFPQQQQHSRPPMAPPAAMNALSLSQLQMQIIELTASLYRDRFLDEQFSKVRELQDQSCPDFVMKVVTVFFNDCHQIVTDIAIALSKLQVVDFNKVLTKVHQLKGCSSSFGAGRIKDLCAPLKNQCELQNPEGCMRCLQEVYHEYTLLQNKFQTLFLLEQQFKIASGAFPKAQ
ncbi:Histidine-containing phosphotransfer protein 5 [Linum perenne]